MDEPFVSVIMPVRNEAQFIELSLNAVLHQDYPAERMEILVADGESDDGTVERIQALPGAERVRIVPNSRRIQSAGLNAALRQARGDIIIRVDGHTVIAPDYVRQCVAALRQTGAHSVGGSIAPVGMTDQGKAIAAACASAFAVPAAFHANQTAGCPTDTVYMGAWPRWVLERVGGFDERLPINEDYDLNYRIRQSGGTIYLVPAIRSRYFGRQTLGALARQYFRYGYGKISMLRKSPGSLRPRQLVAPAFVGVVIGGLPFSLVGPALLLLWLAVLISYLVVSLAFSIRIAKRTSYLLLWRLPLVFATIHLSWGLGFWYGLLAGGRRFRRSVRRVATSAQESLEEVASRVP